MLPLKFGCLLPEQV
uniref:Uncharacterized protein n=1 Tax=Anguilla anguilla TaxID=7936 RepID=A0A0E9XIN4_ANGAN